jgi:hypothetical protein
MPIVPAIWEAEVEILLELKSSRPAWTTLRDSVSPQTNKNKETNPPSKKTNKNSKEKQQNQTKKLQIFM